MVAAAPLSSSAVATLFRLSSSIAFVGGFLTSVVSLLVPRLKLTLGLGYAEALLVQLAFHASYLLFAIPITLVIIRTGYMRAIATGLAIMCAGCLALVAAQAALDFAAILAALLLLAAGITFLQIASNTAVVVVGPSAQAASRLTLTQGFNSLGTVLGPLLCAQLLLSATATGVGTASSIGAASLPFAGSALVLGVLAFAFVARRDLLPPLPRSEQPTLRRLPVLLADRRLRLGTCAMFAYVGAEVTIGALLTSYLMLPTIVAASPVAAGRIVSLYWGGAMLGRFAGAYLLRRIAPARLLRMAAGGAALLATAATVLGGVAGAAALIAVGLCNAIMYPTIYALALPRAEDAAPLGSMLLCMAVVGGAVVPMLTGVAADAFGLAPAFALPALCYVAVAGFAWFCLGAASARKTP